MVVGYVLIFVFFARVTSAFIFAVILFEYNAIVRGHWYAVRVPVYGTMDCSFRGLAQLGRIGPINLNI